MTKYIERIKYEFCIRDNHEEEYLEIDYAGEDEIMIDNYSINVQDFIEVAEKIKYLHNKNKPEKDPIASTPLNNPLMQSETVTYDDKTHKFSSSDPELEKILNTKIDLKGHFNKESQRVVKESKPLDGHTNFFLPNGEPRYIQDLHLYEDGSKFRDIEEAFIKQYNEDNKINAERIYDNWYLIAFSLETVRKCLTKLCKHYKLKYQRKNA